MSTKRRRSKGDGGLFQDSRGIWRGRIELAPNPVTGKRRYREVTSKKYDEAFLKLKKLKARLDEAGDLPTSTPTMGVWLEKSWLPRLRRKRIKPSTLDFYEDKTRNYLIPALGRVKVENIGTMHVRKLEDYVRGKGLSPTTARHAHVTLKLALDDAVRDGHLTSNPCAVMDVPATASSPKDALSLDQVRLLLNVHTDNPVMYAKLTTYLYSGGRKGEILGLSGASPDFNLNMLSIERTIQRLTYQHGCDPECGRKRGAECPERYFHIGPGIEAEQVKGGLHVLRPKSARSDRVIPMVTPLAVTLKKYVEELKIGPRDYLFPAPDGGPNSPEAEYQSIKEAFSKIGVDLRPHTLRHTTATLMDLAQVPEHYRIAILGHAGSQITRRYTHPEMATIAKAMQPFGELLSD